MKKDYELLHPLERDGERTERGKVLSLEEKEANPLVDAGVLRPVPKAEKKAPGQ